MLFTLLEVEIQALLTPNKAARGRNAPKSSKCGNLMKGHKRGLCPETSEST